ncbi:MAG: uroporphyrinogen-III synthase [Methylotenera sp.]|nr:uroporphyrinogen-III synthase [Methylotenera sp.]
MANSLNGAGIAITRPVEQAQKLSDLILAEGGSPISFPLIDIVPLEDYQQLDNTISALANYDWAIFISSNAVQNSMPRVLTKFIPLPANLNFAAIGPVTANELMQMGCAHVLIPDNRYDSESLLSLPEMHHMQGKRVMIFRGIGGREVLAETLTARGASVTFAECYRRINPQPNTMLLEVAWNKGLQAIAVTSSEAMRHLLQMTNNGADTWLRHVHICVNHARVAEEAQTIVANSAPTIHLKLHIADAPGDVAMLACLQRALTTSSSHS